MKKIVIIGSSGAGKSTLAINLRFKLDIKVFHLDRLFWKHRWERRNYYDRMELLEQLAFGEKQWIIEGNYLRSFESALKEADTIIFLDLPPLLCLWRVMKRHYKNHELPRPDIPNGCTDKFTLRQILKTLAFPFHSRKKIKQTLSNCSTQNIITLRSPKEVKGFLAKQQYFENKASQSSILLSIQRKHESTLV